ncbi:hypothetical protein VTJ83DRAFT_7008 [Remersonia thermophila]|uniref:Uncharacterized protein n=1 Tax=Remersonia thermophila TaxID=72144 RepID=A0ABR4D2F4_9PEZI
MPLVIPELPEFWNFGLSGICDTFTATHEVFCRQSFAPTHRLLTVLEESLRDSFRRQAGKENGKRDNKTGDKIQHDSDPELIKTVISSWNNTIAGLSPSGLAAHESKVDALWRAGAILAVGAVAADTAGLIIGFIPRLGVLVVYWIGGLTALADASCVESARQMSMNGPYGTNEGGLGSTARWIFANSCLRLVLGILVCYAEKQKRANRSTADPAPAPPVTTATTTAAVATVIYSSPLEMSSLDDSGTRELPPPDTSIAQAQSRVESVPESEDDSEAEQPLKETVAYLGQRSVYDWFNGSGLVNWSFENWTSPLRSRAGFAAYRPELDTVHADFTYYDTGVQMYSVLRQAGLTLHQAKMYRFKVQATYGPCDERKMRITEDQARLMDQPQLRYLYILVRVFNLGGSPFVRFFLDPRTHPDLQWEPLRNGYYKVRSRNTGARNVVNLTEPLTNRAVEEVSCLW